MRHREFFGVWKSRGILIEWYVWWDWHTLEFDYIINSRRENHFFWSAGNSNHPKISCSIVSPERRVGHEKFINIFHTHSYCTMPRHRNKQWIYEIACIPLPCPSFASHMYVNVYPEYKLQRTWIGDYRKNHSLVTDKLFWFLMVKIWELRRSQRVSFPPFFTEF